MVLVTVSQGISIWHCYVPVTHDRLHVDNSLPFDHRGPVSNKTAHGGCGRRTVDVVSSMPVLRASAMGLQIWKPVTCAVEDIATGMG